MPILGFLAAVAVTLGHEYTSDTVALSCLVASRRNLRPHCPSEVTKAIMSLYLVLAASRSARSKTSIAARLTRYSSVVESLRSGIVE